MQFPSPVIVSKRYSLCIPQSRLSVWGPLAFFAMHIPLALGMRQYPLIGALHAVGALALGLWWIVFRSRPERIAYVGAYITGAEVLWRMTQTPIFWEFGKYAVAGLFIISLMARRSFKAPLLPLLYFALLLASVALTVSSMEFETARKEISFNLSGPFALMVSAWFFSRLELSQSNVRKLFSALIGPIVGVVSIAIFSTLTAENLHFHAGSNFVTSGGFGPNQVSAVLGLGSLLAYLYVVDREAALNVRILMLVVVIVFTTQCALTFSRNGLYNAAISAIAGSLFLLKNNRGRIRLIAIATLIFAGAYYVVLPRLDLLTGGLIETRFGDADSPARAHFAESEFQAWLDNPILGLGPGGSEKYRHELMRRQTTLLVATHTEYTRLLAEHGVLGIEALLLLLVMAIGNFARANTIKARVTVTSLLLFSLLFMAGNAMRLVVPSFLFGLGFATFLPDDKIAFSRWQHRSIRKD